MDKKSKCKSQTIKLLGKKKTKKLHDFGLAIISKR